MKSSDAPYDIIIVGTGVGAAGFVRRLKQFDATRSLRILWLDSAPEKSRALAWPAALVGQSDDGNVPQFPCSSQDYVWALSWRAFGGGDALNSGGPNCLGIQRDANGKTIPDLDPPPMPPANPQLTAAPAEDDPKRGDNVFHLRNNSKREKSDLGDCFIKGFEELGWTKQDVLPATSSEDPETASVGYPSSIYAPGYQSRMLIAQDLVPATETNEESNQYVTNLKLGCKVKRVLFSDGKKACGVVAEDGTAYYADKVVLAAGVFGTFDILLNSGIGPQEYLAMRRVEPVVANNLVGKGLGDESQITVLFCPAKTQPDPPPDGEQSPLVGFKSRDGKLAGVVWPSNLPDLFILYTRVKVLEFLGRFRITGWLVGALTVVYRSLIQFLLKPYAFIGVSLDTPTNRKLMIDINEPERIIYDDNDVQWTVEMRDWYNEARPGIENALEANRKAYGFGGKFVARQFLKILTPIFRNIIGGRLQGGVVTQYNLNPRFVKSELVSYQHYYGGCGDGVVDDEYAVIGVQGLHVCDATVITKFGRKMLPGAPSTTIMQQGMRVADAMYPPK